MMSSSVERWLQTFMCSQYACIFEAYGYKTLHSVCHLQLPHLLAMGVPRNHCEKIVENVNNLRQTMFGQVPKVPGENDFDHFSKYNTSVNPAVWALKSVAMNANYRGMNPYSEDYSGYGQTGNSMQTMGFHQGNYDNANMAMMNPMGGGGGGYPVQGYDGGQSHMMMSGGQGSMAAHSPLYQHQTQQAYMAAHQYYSGANTTTGGAGGNGSGGQYPTQTSYPMQAGGANLPNPMSGGNGQYYGTAANQGQGQAGQAASKMVPPPHHHLRNTSGQQNPQQVADNILQMASSFPSHHTVQVPLKNRHAPYQIARSPQNYYPEKTGGQQQQQGMGAQGQPQMMPTSQSMVGQQQQQQQHQQQAMNMGQMQAKTSQVQTQQMGLGSNPGANQQGAMRYAGSSPHSQVPPRSSPLSPLMMASPVAGAMQAQSLSSPSAMHSPGSGAVCSPVPSSPGLASMRSPCSVPMRSPAHLSSAYQGQGHALNSPPQRPFGGVCEQTQSQSSQHCSPGSLHSPPSHGSSPFTPASLSHHVNSPPQPQPPQPHAYPTQVHGSAYTKMDMLMDSGQGPGGHGVAVQGQGQGQGSSDPLQSLQKLVMLPETQVVDPKSVVSDGCLGNNDEGSKNFEGPAEQSGEAKDCSAGVFNTSSPPSHVHTLQASAGTGSDTAHPASAAAVATPCLSSGGEFSAGHVDSSVLPPTVQSVSSALETDVPCAESPAHCSKEAPSADLMASSSFNTCSMSLNDSCSVDSDTSNNSTASKADLSTQSKGSNCESQPVEAVRESLDTSAAGGRDLQKVDNVCDRSPVKSSPVMSNGLLNTSTPETGKVDTGVNLDNSVPGLTADDVKLEGEEDAKERTDNIFQSDKNQLGKKTASKPSQSQKRHSKRLSLKSSVKPITGSKTEVFVNNRTKTGAENNPITDSKNITELLTETATKTKLVNGFGDKHINGSDSEGVSGNFPQRRSTNRQATSHVEAEKASTEVTPSAKTKPSEAAPISRADAAAVNGPVTVEVHAVTAADTKEVKVESQTEGSSTVSNSSAAALCSSGVESSLPDNSDDDSFNGLDFGYDSPPCEMVGDDSWKPDLEKRLSANGVDEADGNRDGTKGSPDQTGKSGTKDSSSAASVNPAKDTPVPSGRVMTRSSSGRAPKRKPDPVDHPDTKRTRHCPAMKDSDIASLAMECEEIDVKQNFSDVEVISSSDEAPEKPRISIKVENHGTEKEIKNQQKRNCEKSPMVLVNTPGEKISDWKEEADSLKTLGHSNQRRATSTSHFYSVRGNKGRFISRRDATVESGVTSSGLSHYTKVEKMEPMVASTSAKASFVPDEKGDRSQGSQPVCTEPISIDSDSEDEPLISVQRRGSREEGEVSGDRSQVKFESRGQLASSLTHSTSKVVRGNASVTALPAHSEVKSTSTGCGPSMPSPATYYDGSQIKKAQPKKPEAKPVVNKKKKKAKGKKKPAFQVDNEHDPFKDMRLKRTLDQLQKKKKEESSLSAKQFSPFVRLQGTRNSPSKVSVFNHLPVQSKDSKFLNKKNKNASYSSTSTSTIQITNFSSDKTVMRPSSKTTDCVWVCALCGKRSSYGFLGDLFGPYYLESHLHALNKTDNGKKDSKGDTASASEAHSSHNTRRRSLSGRRPSGGSVEEGVAVPQEVWVHEDCAMWSSGVYLVGSCIYGLEEALKAAAATVCASCREKGAMLGCLHKGCNQNFHYMCAVEKTCFLDVENFSLLCPKHKDKRMKNAPAVSSKS